MSAKPSLSTPARLTATATSKLPRAVLFAVGLLYILTGLFFRDPWKTDDVVGLATMLTALEQPSFAQWLLPHMGATLHVGDGPLVSWIGAFSIWAMTPLLELFMSPIDAEITASRFPNLLWFAVMCWGVWYGTYLLGRRPEPQPLALPFGGEPTVRDYGRMIADAALLLTVATIGILWRMHETSSVPALIAFQALGYYAMARCLDRPRQGGIVLGLATAGAFLTRGLLGVLPLTLAALFVLWPESTLGKRRKTIGFGLLGAAALIMLWAGTAAYLDPVATRLWWRWQSDAFTWFATESVLKLLRDLPWFLWPTWPFALLAIWRWRHWMRAPHIRVPLALAVAALICSLFLQEVFEPEYSIFALPCAVLASFALPTLRRGVINSLDWFAVMCFSLTSATVWLGWVALHIGWPKKIAHNIARQTAGYDANLYWPAVLIAAAGTLSWIILVRWRLVTRPAALWRGTVLSAGGLIVTWLLLATLWMPVLDYARSYRVVSAELLRALQQHAESGECLRPMDVGVGQRASFLVFDDIQFDYQNDCPLVLQQTNLAALATDTAYTPSNAQIIWQGKRQPDRHEVFRLLRIGAP